MRAIEQCRTPALGGQVYECPDCGESRYLYHSCRNRHCPKCQNGNAQEWLEAQRDLLLPVPYFLLTFTLPAELRTLARSHQRLCYDLLFRTSAEAAQYLARDPRFVGGQLGLVGVLHILRRGALLWLLQPWPAPTARRHPSPTRRCGPHPRRLPSRFERRGG